MATTYKLYAALLSTKENAAPNCWRGVETKVCLVLSILAETGRHSMLLLSVASTAKLNQEAQPDGGAVSITDSSWPCAVA